ncbi:MAG: DUF3291 domain-containing protein [Chloroflexota bacterium]|nr:DUF3291 domain-containing protein [Chloroflexota bacterium]
MPRIAFFTLNVAREPFSQPQMRGFVERIPTIFAEADVASGFIAFAAAMRLPPDDPAMVWPAAKPADHEAAMTLTLWRDLESVFAFAYSRLHAEALQMRREWTIKPDWPTYVAWWVADDEEPDWREAARRHAMLSARGPTPDAFDFRTPFDAEGRPTPPARKPLGLVSAAQGRALRAATAFPPMALSGERPPRQAE